MAFNQMWHYQRSPNLPIIDFPEKYPVFDLSNPEDRKAAETARFGIGRYNELREKMYETPLFSGNRNIHMGIDFFCPPKTPVSSMTDGMIMDLAYHSAPGDYGSTLITQHPFGDKTLYALYGHLSRDSLEGKKAGQLILPGEIIGWVGDPSENGGWPPHLHFQISFEPPVGADMPGVVSQEQHAEALIKYPDPRIILGPVYL